MIKSPFLWDDEGCRWWTLECRSPRGVVKKTKLLRVADIGGKE